jgi:HK97 family phage prohead protease
MTATILVRAATPTAVRYARREIDVLAVPYDTPTAIVDTEGVYDETIAAGAFGKVSTRADQIKVLRDHHPHRAVGRCYRITDDDPTGLRASMRISTTDLGDETLTLAADGVLDVSIGFASKGGDRWNPARTAVTRTNCWLYELSLVPIPAYDSAKVLAVRDTTMPPPAAAATLPVPVDVDPFVIETLAWLNELRYGPARTH